jgi:outer membrane protein OmpA-like peptidoglycan-associated protein
MRKAPLLLEGRAGDSVGPPEDGLLRSMTMAPDHRKAPVYAAMLGIALLATAGCDRKAEKARAAATRAIDPSADILALPNGGTILAKPGTPERQMGEYLASNAPVPRTFRFNQAEFQPWSDDPSPRTRAALAAVIQILKAYPSARIEVRGYTDNVGTPGANARIATQRVEKLKTVLTQGGVDGARIVAIGMGSTNPIADNATDEGRARNRRVELSIVQKQAAGA